MIGYILTLFLAVGKYLSTLCKSYVSWCRNIIYERKYGVIWVTLSVVGGIVGISIILLVCVIGLLVLVAIAALEKWLSKSNPGITVYDVQANVLISRMTIFEAVHSLKSSGMNRLLLPPHFWTGIGCTPVYSQRTYQLFIPKSDDVMDNEEIRVTVELLQKELRVIAEHSSYIGKPFAGLLILDGSDNGATFHISVRFANSLEEFLQYEPIARPTLCEISSNNEKFKEELTNEKSLRDNTYGW